MWIAHSSPDKNQPPHYLKEHLEGVLKKAKDFSQEFDPYGITALAAMVHDAGKATPEFLNYHFLIRSS
jgi:hypothetical protein